MLLLFQDHQYTEANANEMCISYTENKDICNYKTFVVCMLSCFSRVWLFATLWTIACQVPLFLGFSKKVWWSGLSFPPPGYLPDPEIEPVSLVSPELQVDSLPFEPLRKHHMPWHFFWKKKKKNWKTQSKELS